MLRFILGRSGTGKTREIYRQIREKTESGCDKLIVLIPDQISLETEKEILSLLGAPDKQKVNVFGFNKLCRFVYGQTSNPPMAPIDNGTRAVLMSRTLDDLDGSLRLLNPRSNRSLTSLMLDTLLECKKNCISSVQLRGAAEGEIDESLKKKLLDTADIFDVFNGRLSQSHVDPLDDIDRVNDILASHPEVFSGYTVFIDAFSGFTAQQMKLVEHLVLNCGELVISLSLDPLTESESGVFATTAQTYRRIKRFAKEQGVKILTPVRLDKTVRFQNDELRFLEEGVFRGADFTDKFDDAPENIAVYPADDTYDECEFAARKIKKLIIEENYRYRDIGVITHDTKLYSGIINAVFDKYDIPYFLDEHKDLDVKPVARAINAIFRILLERFERSDVLLLLKSGLLPFTEGEIRDFEDYVFVWDIDNSAFLSEFTQSSRGFGEPLKEDIKRDNAERVRKTVVEALLSFKEESKDKTAGETTALLYVLLTEKLDVRSGMDRLCRRLENGVSENLSDEQVRIWELFARALDRLNDAVGNERMPLRRYYELLSLELSAIEFSEIPRYLDSVIITNAQRVRDPHYKAVFLIGCTEGSFPANPQSAGLFSDYELQTLFDNDLKITENPVDFVNLEIFMAYNCMSAASQRICLSYPKLALSAANEESAGGRLKPSVLIDEVCGLFPKLEPISKNRLPYVEMLVGMDTAFEAYSLSLTDDSADLSELRGFFADDPDYRPRLEAVESAVAQKPFSMQNEGIADELFGKVLDNSASKVQTYYKCPFRYFCEYGLRIDQKRRAEIDPIERGNLVHKVLERFFDTYRTKAEYGELTDSRIKEYVVKEYNIYLESFMGGAADKTGSFAFQFDMLMEKTVRVIRFIVDELKNSAFDVEDTELDFPNDMHGYSYILPDGHEIRIRGKVDRVDSSVQNGEKYIRIIDYKSKSESKGFSLAEAYYGLDLQMLIYLIAITRNGGYRYGEFKPGGVLYSNVLFGAFRESEAAGKTADDLIRGAFKLKGLYVDEERFKVADMNSFKPKSSTKVTPEELETVFSKVDLLIRDMGESLYSGIIPAQPLKSGSSSTCEYCAYEDACSYNMSEPKENMFAAVKQNKRDYILGKMREDIEAANESEVNGDE